MRRLLSVLGIAAALFSSAAPAPAQQIDQRAVIQKMLDRNPELRSFQAHVHVNLRMTSFPFYSPVLDGMSYFKHPNNYEVVFDRVPPFAHGFDHFFSDMSDPSSWERRFIITVAGEPMLDGHRVIELRLVAKIRGMIDHTSVFVDPNTYTVSRLEWHYYNGGIISMQQWYRTEGGNTLLVYQRADINIPHVRANGDARYTDYRTNVAVDDRVFRSEKQ